jgi:enoyl-CoA hydratase
VSVDVTYPDDGVALVTINRPEALNALNGDQLRALRDTLTRLAEDRGVRVVVLNGEGRAFAAGADIKEMLEMDVAEASAWGALGHECARLLETMPKPTVAAINGFALGGGCELALACDLRYASSDAKIGQPEIAVGVIPGWGGTQRLARVAGVGFAKELILTGRAADADEALRRGLVNAVFEPDDLIERVLEVARSLAAKSPLALAAAKASVNRALQGDVEEGLAAEADAFAQLFASEDQKEGMEAFVEKRAPRFSGR